MIEFWEASFKDKQEMWGWAAADSAFLAMELFKKNDLHEILIPGFGYGRNAKVFTDNGIKVEGIEISKTAIEIAQKQFAGGVHCYLENVGLMPFDEKVYDGIFCYALIHLLNMDERTKLINDCYNQLRPGGLMFFYLSQKRISGMGKEKS